MSNFDGSTGESDANIIATESLGLKSKYILPTESPLEGEVIQALGTVNGDGSRNTHWSIIQGVGNVVGPPSSIDGEIAVYNQTTGKVLANSSTLVSALQRNPAIAVQDMANFGIDNVGDADFTKAPSKISAVAGALRLYASSVDNEFHQVDENGVDTIVGGNTFDQELNTTDNVEFGDLTVNRLDINKWTLTPNGRFLQLNSAGSNQGTTNFASKAARIDLERNADNDIAELRMGRSRGSYATPTVLLNNDVLAEIQFQGNDGSAVNNITTAFIEAKCNENWTPTARGSEINFYTTTPGTTTIAERLKISAQGVTVQGDLNYVGTLSGQTIDSTTLQFIRSTAANPSKGIVWATTDDLNDGWLLQAQSNTTDLVVRNANLQNVLTATQTGDLVVLGDVSSKTASTSGAKGSTKLGVDEPVVSDVQFFQSAKGGIQQTYTRGRGTPASPVGLLVDDTIHSIGCFTKDATTTEEAYLVTATATQNHTPTARGTELVFSTTNDNTTTASEKLKLDTSGVRLNDAYTMPLADGGAGQILETDGAAQLSWHYRTYGEMGFIGNALETTFTSGSTDEWQIVNGVYQQGCLNGFSFPLGGSQLVKDGAITRLYRITAGASITKQLSGSALARMAIFINGTEIVRSKQVQSTANTSDFPQHVSSDCVVAVGVNDFVEVKIQNGTDDEALTVINLSLIITEA